MQRWNRTVIAAACAASLWTVPAARAEFLEDAGWGALTVLANVFYMPGKLVYSGLGGLTGGLAYGLTGGDLDTASKVWVPSMGGTYVVTPEMLRGEKEIAFVGGTVEHSAARNEYDRFQPPPYREERLPRSSGEGDLVEDTLGGN